tara:strand:+ start:4081 stop:4272 length:192 start_codon:yes stop_codon:yes gene_type:complete
MSALNTRGIRAACAIWLEKKGNVTPTFRDSINASAREVSRRREKTRRVDDVERIARELEEGHE